AAYGRCALPSGPPLRSLPLTQKNKALPFTGICGECGRETMSEGRAAKKAVFNRTNPFVAELIRHERLTKEGSAKDTRHFVLSLKGGGITYTPGDSLAIVARNPEALVDEVLSLLQLDPIQVVKEP